MFQVCAVFAEFERGVIRERIVASHKRARAEGKHIGRPSQITDGLINSINFMRDKGVGIKRIAADLGIGVGTVYKVLNA